MEEPVADPTLDDQVRDFFDRFAKASDALDVEALGELFDDRPVRLASTFLLRRDGEGLRVVLYLNHQDLRGVLSSG
jgi:hypothetical protein